LGFERSDPSILRIAGAFRARGTTVRDDLEPPATVAATVTSWRAATASAELRTVATRMRERLLADPDFRVGVLAPDVALCSVRLRRERSAVLHLSGSAGSLENALFRAGLGATSKRLQALASHRDRGGPLHRSPSAWRREWIKRLGILQWTDTIGGDTEGLAFR